MQLPLDPFTRNTAQPIPQVGNSRISREVFLLPKDFCVFASVRVSMYNHIMLSIAKDYLMRSWRWIAIGATGILGLLLVRRSGANAQKRKQYEIEVLGLRNVVEQNNHVYRNDDVNGMRERLSARLRRQRHPTSD